MTKIISIFFLLLSQTYSCLSWKWPGSVHDRRVFRNSRINRLLKEDKLSILYKEILPGYDKMQVILIGDPAHPLCAIA